MPDIFRFRKLWENMIAVAWLITLEEKLCYIVFFFWIYKKLICSLTQKKGYFQLNCVIMGKKYVY